MKKVKVLLYFVFKAPGKMTEFNHFRPIDKNALHDTNYTGQKLVAWATEDRPECLAMVKGIKNRMKSKFVCVLNTAISASMTDYFKRVSVYQ